MNNHPITAAVAAIVLVGGLGTLVVSGLRNASSTGGAEDHRAETPEASDRERLKRQLRSAVILGQRGQFEDAKQVFESLVDKYPNEPAVWHNYGIVLSAMDEYAEAERVFAKTKQLEPDNWDVVAELATLRKLQGRLDDALSLLEQIPAGEGRLTRRLRDDPFWTEVDDPRMKALVEKHVLDETSVRAKERGVVKPR